MWPSPLSSIDQPSSERPESNTLSKKRSNRLRKHYLRLLRIRDSSYPWYRYSTYVKYKVEFWMGTRRRGSQYLSLRTPYVRIVESVDSVHFRRCGIRRRRFDATCKAHKALPLHWLTTEGGNLRGGTDRRGSGNVYVLLIPYLGDFSPWTYEERSKLELSKTGIASKAERSRTMWAATPCNSWVLSVGQRMNFIMTWITGHNGHHKQLIAHN